MSDTPRPPGHPSEGNVYRQDDGRVQDQNAAPVNVYTNTPAPPSSSGSFNLRNVIIGALITAAGSISVYYATVFMNRNKAEKDPALETKKTTKSVWDSFVTYENVYAKNLLSFEKAFLVNASLDDYLGGLRTESAKFTKDVGDLAKTKHTDPDLVKAMNRRLENERVSLLSTETFFNTLQTIMKDSSLSRKAMMEKYITEQVRWNREIKGMYERAINDIEEIVKTLSERYSEKFSMNDLLVVRLMPQRMKTTDSLLTILENSEVREDGSLTPVTDVDGYSFSTQVGKEDITGTWNAAGNGISFSEDGKTLWVLSGGEKASGNWKIEENMVRADVTIEKNKKKVTWRLKVSQLTPNSLTLTNADPPGESYHLVRIQMK